ncbi:MAG: hypothetical protein M3O36_16510 [Myxococcota bacterium]|nr:hypothetical protein [Myxococcota bacterium]
MRPRAAYVALFAALACVLRTGVARGTECSGIISPCVNSDTLWVHAGPARFVAVGAGETVAPRQLGFGLVTSYLSRPIVLHVAAPGGLGTEENAINDQVNGTFLWSYGVTDRLALDLALPLTFGQGGTGLSPVTGGRGLRDTAVRDMRFGFVLAIAPHPRVAADPSGDAPYAGRGAFGMVGRLEVSAPTGDGDQFAGERSAVFVPSLAVDGRSGRWFAGVEVGVRLRPTTQLLSARVGSAIVTAVGAGYDILRHERLSAVVEAWAVPNLAAQADVSTSTNTLVSTPNGAHIVPAEWQLSARSAPLRSGDLSLQLGGGGSIPLGSEAAVTAPRFRITLGVRWAPLGHDSGKDGGRP